MFKKLFSLFAALTLSVGLWAAAPVVGDQFEDATSGLMFEVTAVGEANTVKVIKNNYIGTSYTVPATVSYQSVTFNVTEIGMEAFDCCASLQSVTLSEGLLTIGTYAFYGCSSLESITLPAGLTTIEESAFSNCALESVNMPASVTTIGGFAFSECSSLQSVTLPENLTTIGENAFYSCSSLQSVTLPASVTTIGVGAFYKCAGLTSVTFLGNACQNAIGEWAFYEVGKDAPALLTLHGTWAKENQPDEDGNWYGGKFELAGDPTTLPQMRAAVKATKVMTNSQVIFRKENKNFSVFGQEIR